jgi:PAS domain S-box-containing protein
LQGGVTVRLTAAAGHAVLEVTDTGVGVPEHEVPRLFERFHRVEGTHGRTHEGSGIGLALVQELVRLHGGTVEASSELGAGTSFRVRVPFGSQHLPAERVRPSRAGPSALLGAQAFVQEALRWLDNAEESATLTAFAESSFGRSADRFATTFGSRILLADDNGDMRHYITELLKPFYIVETCSDGAQALAAARKARPGLILSDVMMPNLDGFGLLAGIRADDELRNVPVVLLSARAGEEARIEGLDAGADDYLIKPFSARELLARVGALLELTQMRRAADEAFRLRTAQFETLLREAPLGVYLVDADFRIREANPTARRMFGDDPDPIGSDFAAALHRLWPRNFADEVSALFRRTLDSGEPYFTPEHIETRADTGVVEYYEWQINRIPLPDGRFGVVCYFRDISAHVQARRLLETADRQKDEFLAMLAHELRNPLAPIRNAADVLVHSQPQTAVARKAIEIVQRQVGNIARLVDDLLDVSRITLGRIELQSRPVNVNDLVTQALEIVDPLIHRKRHSVTVTARGTLRVHGDPARIVQCIANVLTNAAKYTDPGGEIRIESKLRDGDVVISIADNGVGIAPELLPHLFKLFVQSKRTLDRSQGGLGIGLSVVQRLIEMHGGYITAHSDGIGLGSTFEIHLPSIDRADEPVAAAPAASVEPRRVLVVDDNEDAANTLAMILSLDGHAVRTAYSAKQSLEELARFAPDVVLLDIGLPEMDGYEVARRIRDQYGREGVRLVAVTGYGQQEDRQRAHDAGFDAHLVKPVEMRLLTQALAGWFH